jgi:hypothetical protein
VDDRGSGRGWSRPTASPPGGNYVPLSETESLSSEPTASQAPPAVDCCAACGAPLASDQRYCLECGVRRPTPGSALAGDLQSLVSLASSEPTPATPAQSGPPPVATEPVRTGGASAVIAGVGVLLLAMGVGVLIGRSGASAKAGTQPAQVISVATPAAGSASSATGQAPTSGSSTPSPKKSSSKHSSSKPTTSNSSTEAPAGGVGQTPNKPAPPSVAEHLKGSKGGNYEQKSKNLPNVISTG